MKINFPAYILVNSHTWAKTSFRHPWQKVFMAHLHQYNIYKYGDTRKNSLQNLKSQLAKELNLSTSPACLIVNLHKATPAEFVEFLTNIQKDNISLTLSSTTNNRLVSFLTKKLLFGFSTTPYSAIKILPHLLTYNLHQSDLSLRSDHSLLSLAKTLALQPTHIGVRPGKASEIAHVIAKKVSLLFAPPRPAHIPSNSNQNMIGAGMIHKGHTFITHTTLRERASATNSFSQKQILFLISMVTLFVFGLLANPITTMIAFTATLSAIYFLDVLFNLYLVSKSIHTPPELEFTPEQVNNLEDKELPIYTILVPLYKEANVLPHFLESMEKLNYPKEKLDVMLLLEEDDKETIQVAKGLKLPQYVRAVIVPHSMPKTKPKACNFGLSMAKGEYIVIYDAEDQPDPDQLKKAILGFRTSPANVGCLQAKLNYHNKDQNLLTRFFTAEYSLWFDVILPGLQSINTSIPLGGTSNHFRVKDLITFQGWDAFNVTEDADLGSRLFKAGYKTAIINSVTLEEANSKVGNWVRQRSRWIKGYMQTFLVHNRNFRKFFKEQGIHALVFQLTVGGKIAFMLINPLLWLATISYFVLYSYVGPTIESFYPAPVFYMAAFSLVFGNFLFLYYYMIGVAKHGHWSLVKYIYLVPFYWLLISRAALKALYQLFLKPHYWEKTIHGLHIKTEKVAEVKISNTSNSKIRDSLKKAYRHRHTGTALLVFASLFGNVMNFLYSAYLGNTISLEQFGLISLFSSFGYLTQIPFSVFSNIVTQSSAYHFGKEKAQPKYIWRRYRKWALAVSAIFTLSWLISLPYLRNLFRGDSLTPFFVFTPVWIIGLLSSVDGGFLSGTHRFKVISVQLTAESVSKLLLSILFVVLGQKQNVYLALPLSMSISFLIGWYYAKIVPENKSVEIDDKKIHFPYKFAGTIILNKLSLVAFLGLDVLIAKIVLSPVDAGRFALVSLIGKMLFFFSSLSGQFIMPLVSKEDGDTGNPIKVFNKIFLITVFFTFSSYIGLGLFGRFFLPLVFGSKMNDVLHLLPFYLLGIAAYTLASTLISYHLSRRNYLVSIISFLIALLQVDYLFERVDSLENYCFILGLFGVLQLLVVGLVHRATRYSVAINQNTYAFFNLFKKDQYNKKDFTSQLRFLILNWRDTKHKWAGGAESYVHELAKNLVDKGHRVTIFCGNDGGSKNRDIIDGVEVIRRGGFFTVYLWAALYYVFKFQDCFDIIIDSENGIPFFTPLYSRRPKFLLMHHVHQEFFNNSLKFPMREVAKFFEGKLMPIVYRNEKVMTVSESTKIDVLKLGIFKPENICIVNPGIEVTLPKTKISPTLNPSILYLGRLKPYKNVDIAIKSFKKVLAVFPEATLNIAGEGDCELSLKSLAKDLGIENSVIFHGRVSDQDRAKLYAQSWLMVQPSSHEGWGITVIEANLFGTPVIASDIPGLRDSVIDGQTGILVKPRSVTGFSKAIIKLVRRDTLRERLSRAGIERAKKFNWSENTDIFLSAINHFYFSFYTNSAK